MAWTTQCDAIIQIKPLQKRTYEMNAKMKVSENMGLQLLRLLEMIMRNISFRETG